MFIKERDYGESKVISVRASEEARWVAGVRIFENGEIFIEWNRPLRYEEALHINSSDPEAMARIEDAKGFLKSLEKAIELAEATEIQNGHVTNK